MNQGNRLACPHCLSADHIGEYVTGWREIRAAYATANGKFMVDSNHFSRVYDAEHAAFFCSGPNCNVDDEIPFHRMVQLDRDGQPIPEPIPGQQTLA